MAVTGTDPANSCSAMAAPCASIRHALAVAGDSGDVIDVAAGTYHEHDLTVAGTVTVDGAGPAKTVIDADHEGQAILVDARGSLTMSGITIEDGTSPAHAGAIENSGSLALTRDSFTGNAAVDPGGAIVNYTTITTLTDDQFTKNRTRAYGGAISNFGTIGDADDDAFVDNFGNYGAGAIDNSGTIKSLDNSTFTANTAAYAGALDNDNAIGDLSGDTFWNNQVDGYGAGLVNVEGTIATLTDDTFVGNTVIDGLGEGGAIENDSSTIGLLADDTFIDNQATIGAGINNTGSSDIRSATGLVLDANSGTQGPNCYNFQSTFVDTGYNLQTDTDTSCGFNAAAHDQIGVQPDLRPLGAYGGPTLTAPPSTDSPVINAIPASDCATPYDQRGVPRPQGKACDLGAVELAIPVADHITPAKGPASGGTAVRITGSGFTLATALSIGGTPTRFHVVDDSTITAVTPPGRGTEKISIMTPDGRSSTALAFRYL